jgi:hypothetical protein
LLPTDDWPFLYLRSATIPGLNLRGMALIALLSLIILGAVTPVRGSVPTARCSSSARVHAAGDQRRHPHGLLFGATWVVNSIVFSAILVMILLSNLCVLAMQPRRLWPYYTAAHCRLLVNVYVPMSNVFSTYPVRRRWSHRAWWSLFPVFFGA